MFLDLFEQECALCSSFRRPGSASTKWVWWPRTHCSGFLSELSTVRGNNFCLRSLQDWGVAWEAAMMGARAKLSETFLE